MLERVFTKKNCAIITGVIFLLSLLPLYALTRYAYISADDFTFLNGSRPVWDATHSVAEVIAAAIRETANRYYGWQGNFFFTFLMYLQPASFGEQYYWISGVAVLTVFSLSMVYFLQFLLRDLMKASGAEAWLVSLLLTLLAVQFCYEPVEGFYWHCGAFPYTFTYSLNLLFLVFLFRAVGKEGARACWLRIIPLALFAFLIGGSNYSSALVTPMILVLYMAYLLVQRESRPRAIPVGVVLAFLAAGLIISVVAPGNAVRQSMTGEASAVKGIVVSLAYGAYSMANATTVPVLMGWLAVCPLVYRLAKKSGRDFRFPLIVLVLLFGVYSALGTPCFYAQGFAIPERNINLIYFSYYPVVLTALFYVFGWAARKFEGSLFDRLLSSLNENYACVFLCAAVLFCVACVGRLSAGKGEDGGLEIGNFPAAGEAAFSMLTGEAQAFYDEMEARAAVCRASAGEDVVLEPLENRPEFLAYLDITTDPDDWKNRDMAEYYGLNSVRLSE
ncbi:MAG: hypothetical protein E7442_01685 [Ruminococcaceae bacterium]|nr:hypothetical protein [Oscillospiraceae bacterium]